MSKKIKNGISYDLNGWKYISVKGSASERGYAYGYFIAKEFKKIQEMLNFVIYQDFGETWDFFIDASTKLYNDKIKKEFKEFYDEMDGIAKGINAGGTKTSLDEIIAWNNYFALTEGWYSNKDAVSGKPVAHHGEGGGGRTGASERCSCFMATGDYTSDGKIVCAHNNFSNFVDGQYANCVVDMHCDNGNRFLMQCFCGYIWSGTDFFVTDKGIIGSETTIGGFLPFENNYPISCRIRKAMQYGDTLDDYVKILLDGNSGDYANSWYFGDINTNEILRIELGLKYYNVERTKNGFFIGFNAAFDPKIRNLECVAHGFNDIRRHQGSRKVRLEDLVEEHKGKINIEVAKLILSDHYDVYLNKENPCSRTVCSHYNLDPREYTDSTRPDPYQPRGAIDGSVIDSTMAKNMSFELKFGSSCDIAFDADEFFDKHRQWKHLKPYVFSRPLQPYTLFKITDKYSNSNTSKGSNKANTKSNTSTINRIKSQKQNNISILKF